MAIKLRNKGKKAKVARKKAANSGPMKQMTTVSRLDQAAIDHINLLADPCNGKLVYGAYPNAGGGVLQRVRAVLSVGTAAGETAGVFHWIPGVNYVYINGAATPTTSFTPSSSQPFPGFAYSDGESSATAFRCVAACARVITNASEMNRAGICYAGNTAADYFGYSVGATATTTIASSGLPVSARIPSGAIETLWVPMLNDQGYYTAKTGAGAAISIDNGWGAITYGFTGMPAGTGVTIELTAVYEIEYKANGTIQSIQKPPSRNAWQDIIRGFYDTVGGKTTLVDVFNKGADYLGHISGSTIGQIAKGAALAMIA